MQSHSTKPCCYFKKGTSIQACSESVTVDDVFVCLFTAIVMLLKYFNSLIFLGVSVFRNISALEALCCTEGLHQISYKGWEFSEETWTFHTTLLNPHWQRFLKPRKEFLVRRRDFLPPLPLPFLPFPLLSSGTAGGSLETCCGCTRIFASLCPTSLPPETLLLPFAYEHT